ARQAYLSSLQIIKRLAQAEPQRADYQRDLSASYNRLGGLYRDFGEIEQAQDYDMKDLEIAERLAQMEPERADYQRDLVVSLAGVGSNDHDVVRRSTMLRRALAIVEQMQANGQLAPVDEGMVEWVRGLLGEIKDE
ncbi:MAG TPA: hypothetical protein VFQ45_07500, partial [Longimicrobium sp.]|nr:hypothetical protein [Longimicrobium sp.]